MQQQKGVKTWWISSAGFSEGLGIKIVSLQLPLVFLTCGRVKFYPQIFLDHNFFGHEALHIP